jgi:hypothetical protein
MSVRPMLVVAVLSMTAAEAVQAAPLETPAAVVEAVYHGHFAHHQRFDETLKRERARFAAPLLALLDADGRAAAANPDEVVGLDFDPLTNGQEEATAYTVGKATIDGAAATVPVLLRFGSERTNVTVHLAQAGGRWVVANVVSSESDLVKVLKDLAAERASH